MQLTLQKAMAAGGVKAKRSWLDCSLQWQWLFPGRLLSETIFPNMQFMGTHLGHILGFVVFETEAWLQKPSAEQTAGI